MRSWLRRLRARMFRRGAEAELAEELRYHLERQAEALEGDGLDGEEARRSALRRFGNPVLTAERCRDQRRLGWAEDAADDLRLAARGLRQAPGFTLAAIALLALGIGAAAALFGPLYSLVLSPLPFPQPSRLVRVGGVPMPYRFAYPRLRQALKPVFSHIAQFDEWGSENAPHAFGPALRITGVTTGFFRTVGVEPRLGRDFRSGDSLTDGVIISDAVWRTRLHAKSNLSGAFLRVGPANLPVAGVMPPSFNFPAGTQVWELQPVGVGLLFGSPVIARLQPGLSPAAALVRLRTIAKAHDIKDGPVSLQPLHDYLLGDRRPLLWMFWAVAVLFLLLACAGVANLFLVRGIRRQPEFALRLALGGGRARLLRQQLAEALLLAGGGAALGLGLAALAGASLRAILPVALGRTAFAPHPALAASAALVIALAVATACVFGLLPAWRAARTDAGVYLKSSGGAVGVAAAGRRRFAARELLVGGQLAMALALLVASGLLARSVEARLNLNFGFPARHVVAVEAELPPLPAQVRAAQAFDRLQLASPSLTASNKATGRALKESGMLSAWLGDEERDISAQAEARAELAGAPGVLSAGVLSPLPFNGQARPSGLEFVQLRPRRPGLPAYLRYVSGDFVHALGMHLLAGHAFTPTEVATAARVQEHATLTYGSPRKGYVLPVVINRALADHLWPGRSPLGKRLYWEYQHCRVVGVVSNIHESSANLAIWPTVYQPAQFNASDTLTFIARLRPGVPVAAFRAAARRIIAGLAPGMAPPRFINLAARAENSWANLRLALALLACFAVLGIVVAGLAVYAAAAQMAAARRREMGIRIALGARPQQIRRLALWRSLRLALAAVPFGAFAAWVLARGLSHWLFRVGALDPASYAGAAALLVALALAAGIWPAHRAATADPAAALRDDG